jgi:hypothetical protein
MVIIVDFGIAGLVIDDLTFNRCKNITGVDVSTAGATLTPWGLSDLGRYELEIPLAAEGTTFEVYVTDDPSNYQYGEFSDIAKESTLLALSDLSTIIYNRIGAFTGTGINTVLGFFKALLKKDAAIPSDIGGTFSPVTDSTEAISDKQSGSFLGLLYSVISLPGIETEFLPIKIVKGEHKTFSWEIKEGGVSKDISAYTASMGVKLNLDDVIYQLGPFDGVISANADGVMSILSFTFMTADTKDEVPCDGLYAIALYKDGEKYKLTQAGGVEFSLNEDILDIVPVVL